MKSVLLVWLTWGKWLTKFYRYWHQIADSLLNYTKSKAFDQTENTDLLTLHRELINGLASRLNPIKYALIMISVSRQFTDIEEGIKFLETASKLDLIKRDAHFLL
jgi:hypothetical protein